MNLKSMVDDSGAGFGDLDTLFPPTSSNDDYPVEEAAPVDKMTIEAAVSHDISYNEEPKVETPAVEEPVVAPKRRGRPPKAKVERDKTEREIVHEVKQQPKKRGPKAKPKVDELPLDVLEVIYNNYSTMALEKLSKKTGLEPSWIEAAVEKMEEYFQMAIVGGDLDPDVYESEIAPHLCSPVNDTVEQFVKTTIKKLG